MTEHDDHPMFLEAQRRRLEDSFFMEKDKKLIENLKAMKKMKETKKALAKVSGIHNDTVLEKLVALDVRPETLAPLAIVPLVEVAWADGAVHRREEEQVLAAAGAMGIKTGSIEYSLIREWLEHKPPAKLLTAWIHYIEGLCGKLNMKEKEALKNELLGHARSIAEASGGLMGLGAVSAEEKRMLEKMEKAFGC